MLKSKLGSDFPFYVSLLAWIRGRFHASLGCRGHATLLSLFDQPGVVYLLQMSSPVLTPLPSSAVRLHPFCSGAVSSATTHPRLLSASLEGTALTWDRNQALGPHLHSVNLFFLPDHACSKCWLVGWMQNGMVRRGQHMLGFSGGGDPWEKGL